jgi:4'-phosphopantetheinyl transferase
MNSLVPTTFSEIPVPEISLYQLSSSTVPTTLPKGAIHIWQADLQQQPIQPLINHLSADELARANRFHFERDRRRYIVARGVLRQLLGSYLGCQPDSIQFTYSPQAKPSLLTPLNNPPLHFNLSHSLDSALFAFAHCEVGIDIEATRADIDSELIAPGVFSPSELRQWQALPSSQKHNAFFSLWTRKEALVKAFGKGIGYPLGEVSVNFSTQPAAQIRFAQQLHAEGQARFIWEIPVQAGFLAALAV